MSRSALIRSRLPLLIQPATALIVASIFLPAMLFAFAAWMSYGETLNAAEARVDRTVRILQEHALKVFETNRLVIQQVNTRLRFMDWTRESDREDLHRLLESLQRDLDQVSTVTVMDAQGKMLASGRSYPANPDLGFTDRDFFQTLKASSTDLPFVSMTYTGRQSHQAIFNLADRITPGPNGTFAGIIAVSADRSYFENFYKGIDPSLAHSVILVRADGAILAAEPPLSLASLPVDSTLRAKIKLKASGAYTSRSRLDGIERIFAYHQIGAYPVYVRFGLSKAAALEPWRLALINYGLVATLASIALVAASTMAGRQTNRERIARRRWEETAAALAAEAANRERVEGQLRQAQKMEAVGRLTGGVAHDFNNLLTAVIGSLDLLLHRKNALDPRGLKLVGNALEGAQRAASLTSRLLAFSRQQPLQPVQVDVNRLVEGMLDLLRRTLGETITIETHLAVDLPPTLADPNQLESAILNLAVNARDAMPDGGRLSIQTGRAEVHDADADGEEDSLPRDCVMVSVTDTGCGMPPEVVSHVFEPFFTTKAIGQGTGLGLSQVYGFVKQSGGHVAVVSDVGRGSTFRLYLPRSHAEPTLEEPPASPRRGSIPRDAMGTTILVVEDEAMVRDVAVAALEDAGYRVLVAADGPAGVALARRHREIALLFTDVVLGGSMNGRVLADTLLREQPDLLVLFTTGYTRDAILHAGHVDKDVNLLGKPYTAASLLDAVHDLLARRRGSAERAPAAVLERGVS